MRGTFRVFGVVCGLISVMLLSSLAFGQQFAAILRDENALGLTPTTRSWGMGGTYVGVEEPWSMNPACITGTEFLTLEAGYGHWNPQYGSNTNSGRLDLWAPMGAIGLDVNGALRLMMYSYDSSGSEDALPPFTDLKFDSITLGLQAGLELTDWWTIGIGAYPYEKGEVELLLGGDTTRTEVEAMSQVGSIQLGTLFRLPYNLKFGSQFIYIIDEMKADYGGPASSDAEAKGTYQGEDDFHISYGAFGLSWEPVEWLLLGVDYWTGEAEGASFVKDRDFAIERGLPTEFDVDVDRWNFGAEIRPCDYFSFRAGSANGGTTTGFTVSPQENIDINYAFIYEAFGDKENVWGRTNVHTVSLTCRF